jgi:hypothetical protein
LVDISRSSCENNIPFYSFSGIKEFLRSKFDSDEPDFSFSLMLYDTNLHFVKFKLSGQTPHIITMDVKKTEPGYQLGLRDFSIYKSEISFEDLEAQLDVLIDDIQQEMSGNSPTWDNLKNILKFVSLQIRPFGGKLSWVHGSVGAYVPKKNSADPNKRSFYNCNDADLQKISAELHMSFAHIDFYIFNHSQNKNLSSVGELVRLSGGDAHLYVTSSESHLVNFYNDLIHNCSKSMTWETVFRLRVSDGWKKHAFGNFFTSNYSDLLKMQSNDENYSLYYKFFPQKEKQPKIISDTFFVQVISHNTLINS